MISFTVHAIPVAQPRQRHRVISSGGRTFATNFTPRADPVNAYKATVRLAASAAYTGPPLDGPLLVSLVFVMPRPKAMRWKSRPMPRAWQPTGKDLDNLAKSTLDALIGLLFVNDCQVCRLLALKVIAAGDEAPHVEAEIDELSNIYP